MPFSGNFGLNSRVRDLATPEVPVTSKVLDKFVASVTNKSAVSAAIDAACGTSEWWGSYVNGEEQKQIYTNSETLAIVEQEMSYAEFKSSIGFTKNSLSFMRIAKLSFWLPNYYLIDIFFYRMGFVLYIWG